MNADVLLRERLRCLREENEQLRALAASAAAETRAMRAELDFQAARRQRRRQRRRRVGSRRRNGADLSAASSSGGNHSRSSSSSSSSSSSADREEAHPRSSSPARADDVVGGAREERGHPSGKKAAAGGGIGSVDADGSPPGAAALAAPVGPAIGLKEASSALLGAFEDALDAMERLSRWSDCTSLLVTSAQRKHLRHRHQSPIAARSGGPSPGDGDSSLSGESVADFFASEDTPLLSDEFLIRSLVRDTTGASRSMTESVEQFRLAVTNSPLRREAVRRARERRRKGLPLVQLPSDQLALGPSSSSGITAAGEFGAPKANPDAAVDHEAASMAASLYDLFDVPPTNPKKEATPAGERPEPPLAKVHGAAVSVLAQPGSVDSIDGQEDETFQGITETRSPAAEENLQVASDLPIVTADVGVGGGQSHRAPGERDAHLWWDTVAATQLSEDQMKIDSYSQMRFRFRKDLSRQLFELRGALKPLPRDDRGRGLPLSVHDAPFHNNAGLRGSWDEAANSSGLFPKTDANDEYFDAGHPARPSTPPRLDEARTCYVCRQNFRDIHWFYDKMCIPCGDFNFDRRDQSADLVGYTALVTGCRIKIGYHITLRLLRAGAVVLGTTRFPHDALRKFRAEEDFAEFENRLVIYGIDLCVLSDVEDLCLEVIKRFPEIDIVINNAAVTVEKPKEFFAELISYERKAQALALEGTSSGDSSSDGGATCTDQPPLSPLAGPWRDVMAGEHLGTVSAASSTAPDLALWPSLAPTSDQGEVKQTVFGVLDETDQVLDLRGENTWRTGLENVTTSEFLRVQSCNLFAPFALMKHFGGAMMEQRGIEESVADARVRHKYIINVSAMEGVFYTTKTGHHAHTNAAKAALNMLTRTVAEEWAAKYGIFVTAVDTGWCTDEKTLGERIRVQNNHGSGGTGVFSPPLDCVDGAARVLDPIFSRVHLAATDQLYGVFLKDYEVSLW